MKNVELVYEAKAELGEGPVWHKDALWWVDIEAGMFNRLDVSTGRNMSRPAGDCLGAAAPCTDGRWLLARGADFSLLDWETGEQTSFAKIDNLPARQRLNDGKCDPTGRFWVGSFERDLARNRAHFYALEADGEVRQIRTDLSLSNGLAWSGDGSTMYHIDTLEQSVFAFEFDAADGVLGRGKTLAKFDAAMGSPDGMAIDCDDNLWIALWGGSAVVKVSGRDGRILERVELTTLQPSSCCFGGPDYQSLYVTSAWIGMSEEQRSGDSIAGSIFRIETPVCGLPPVPFQIR